MSAETRAPSRWGDKKSPLRAPSSTKSRSREYLVEELSIFQARYGEAACRSLFESVLNRKSGDKS